MRLPAALAAVTALWWVPLARGQGEPLAACALQSFVEEQTDYLVAGADYLMPEGDLDNTISYRRSLSGDWLVPKEVDATDPTIRGLLFTPLGPMRIDLRVYVGGDPYLAIQEQWIDEALEAAQTGVTPEPQRPATDEESPPATAGLVSDATRERFLGATPRSWLVSYAQRAGAPLDRFEARWLLAQRSGGPALLELERFATSRGAAAPVVRLLDADSNGVLSAQEIVAAGDRIASADANEDGDVSLQEIQRALPEDASGFQVWRAAPLFVVLSDQTNWAALARHSSGPGHTEPDEQKERLTELKALQETRPQVVLEVRFEETSDAKPVTLLESGGDMLVTSWPDAIGVNQGPVQIELGAGRATGATKRSQVSVGGVVEGSPLLTQIDVNRDEIISYRERQAAAGRLQTLDQDGDSSLSAGEIPTRIRLAVAMGSNVHRMLQAERKPPRPTAPAEAVAAPPWFLSMDANKDGDLSANEFLGSADQFQALDANHDGLIDEREATRLGG